MDETIFLVLVAFRWNKGKTRERYTHTRIEIESLPQGIQNKLSYNGMVAVEGIPTTRIIVVFALLNILG